MAMNGLYSSLVNSQMKQEYSEVNETSSIESDNEMKDYEFNSVNISPTFDGSNTSSLTSQNSNKVNNFH